MGFPKRVANEVLVKCGRRCCICKRFVGSKIELHHIKPVAEGGSDESDNCIPVCFNCHADIGSYNTKHPKGRKYTEEELIKHRDSWYEQNSGGEISIESSSASIPIFDYRESDNLTLWGYPEQDKLCPILPGYIVMIAGYSGNKKSIYLHHIANFNAINNKNVIYCSLKNTVLDTSFKLLSENTGIEFINIKTNCLSKKEILLLTNSSAVNASSNIAVIPYEQVNTRDKILFIVEKSKANIVIIDDFNGIEFSDDKEVELFLYRLKNIASKNSVNVFLVYNLMVPKNRYDKRPTLNDFPSEAYYRVVDILHFLYYQSLYDEYNFNSKKLEVNMVKGLKRENVNIEMVLNNNETCIFPFSREKNKI